MEGKGEVVFGDLRFVRPWPYAHTVSLGEKDRFYLLGGQPLCGGAGINCVMMESF